MKAVLILITSAIFLVSVSCKKKKSEVTDVKTKFVGNWAGALQPTSGQGLYKFSLAVNTDNTVLNIDSAFSNQLFPGTYSYTADSLIINYNNGTIWRMKFLNNYTGCSGNFLGYSGVVGTVNMTKK